MKYNHICDVRFVTPPFSFLIYIITSEVEQVHYFRSLSLECTFLSPVCKQRELRVKNGVIKVTSSLTHLSHSSVLLSVRNESGRGFALGAERCFRLTQYSSAN